MRIYKYYSSGTTDANYNIWKNSEVATSSYGLEVADYEKNWIAELQLRTKISLKSCGITIAEVLPSSCGIAMVDLKKSFVWLQYL